MKTGIPGPEGSGAKLWWSEAGSGVTKLALDLLGAEAQVMENGNYWQHQQLREPRQHDRGRHLEILRNIIAERVLGLPRSR